MTENKGFTIILHEWISCLNRRSPGERERSEAMKKSILKIAEITFSQAPVCSNGTTRDVGCVCMTEDRLTEKFRSVNCLPVVICGEKWETVWASAEACKTLGLSHLNGTHGNIRTHDG